jgi:hypothetical protein
VTLPRISVLFVLELANRSVHLLGVTTNPDGWWTTQQVCILVMDLGDRITEFRFLVRDRAGQFSITFTQRLAETGIDPSVGSVGDAYDKTGASYCTSWCCCGESSVGEFAALAFDQPGVGWVGRVE